MIYPMAIGLSAFLLFLVQPLLTKALLPHFGGGASIWLTAIIFFQGALLVGYGLTHWMARRLSPRLHKIVQGFLIGTSLTALPLALGSLHYAQNLSPPWLSLAFLLTATVGPPYLVLSTTSPAVQHWISLDPHRGHDNPYLFYAVSNIGSLGGLLIYPFVVEVWLPLSHQRLLWTAGYLVLATVYLAVLIHSHIYLDRSPTAVEGEPDEVDENTDREEEDPGEVDEDSGEWEALDDLTPPSTSTKLFWLFASAVPSACLLAITHYLTVDLVNFPLLWVFPLALYLLSFVLVFAFPILSYPHWIRRLFLTGLVAMFIVHSSRVSSVHIFFQLLLANLGLTAVCLYYHGELERSKPHPRHLTWFYLCLSTGGVLGSLAVGLVAPLVFSSTIEVDLAVYIAFLGMIYALLDDFPFPTIRKGLYVVGLLVIVNLFLLKEYTWLLSEKIVRARSFYGAYEVHLDLPPPSKARRDLRLLYHGTTCHGGHIRNEKGELVPLTYFHRETAVGRYLDRLPPDETVAIVGMGTGVLAVYGKKGQTYHFYEIDPVVVDLARTHFDNLASSPANIEIITGDGRKALAGQRKNTYRTLILDAFTSDSVPTHLLTREAMSIYRKVVTDDGVIFFNISNRHLDLRPVISGLARAFDLEVRYYRTGKNKDLFWTPARWAVLARDFSNLDLGEKNRLPSGGEPIYWTDDYTGLWPLLKFD